jgi:hypothetical protein
VIKPVIDADYEEAECRLCVNFTGHGAPDKICEPGIVAWEIRNKGFRKLHLFIHFTGLIYGTWKRLHSIAMRTVPQWVPCGTASAM